MTLHKAGNYLDAGPDAPTCGQENHPQRLYFHLIFCDGFLGVSLPRPAPGSGRVLRPPPPGSSPGYGATRSRLAFPPRRRAVLRPDG